MVNLILVNEKDEQIGVEEKIETHRKGLLHRAFSVFIFNDKKELLIQQRASTKYHCPNIWSNTVCSHPFVGEENIVGARRRLMEELGFTCELEYLGNLIYRAEFNNGLTENEFDHIFAGCMPNLKIKPNPDEVQNYKWISLGNLKEDILRQPENFSTWLKIIISKHINLFDKYL